ncbi:hypothetical protein BW723_13515 [Polaribacter reichenbachii]|uniref:DUF2520 domain-containing protein n=1 Tax=Polaribacter reichenbachii TaxID=996801 RepID=A0A1B8U1Q2_9FLAO|nr:DUF2520 domain-containing protein [Polaribacter reichenbachii]APZ47237.1 hypothetical protein BW723_13515 [Polaribacter reichenbachii]AUC17878.1 hypothetical protein BTO17_03970 [Polaribacter reichenbachii]OBY65798.1 hypothetical protein LPB301_08265 [Polaribacter reichenbachii]
MISVLVIGKGNVGFHLYNVFSNIDKIKVTQISSRKLQDIPKADITIIAVSDDAIAEVSSKIKNTFIVHTSGASSINQLKNTTRKGVFYMLQTFSKNKKVDFSDVPYCLEAENQQDYKLLETLAKLIGNKIYAINSEQRKIIHVAAVFVNNFTNHLFKIGNDICNTHDVPFEILMPLIQETATKIKELSPENAQTGPAIRKDQKTIKNHLALLNKEQQKIYTILTESIQNGN